MDNPDIVTQIEGQPWYQSSMGPRVSATVKSLAALIVPVLMNLGVLKTGLAWLDSAIDVLCIVGFGGYALYGYIRSKAALKAKVVALQTQVKSLGAVPRV